MNVERSDEPPRARLAAVVGVALLVMAALAAAAAVALDPAAAAKRFSRDGRIEAPAIEWIAIYRVISLAASVALAAAGVAAFVWRARLGDHFARRRTAWSRVLLVAGGLALGVAAIEVGLRASGAGRDSGADPSPEEFLRSIREQLDADGQRGTATSGAADGPAFTVLVVGDSMVFGWGIRDGAATFCSRLAVELSTRAPDRSFRVVNAGVPGDDTVQETARLPALLARHAPDLVLLGYYLNDIESFDERNRFYLGRRLLPLVSDNVLRRSAAWRVFEDGLVRALEGAGIRPTYYQHLGGLFDPGSARLAAHREEVAGFFATARQNRRRAAAIVFPAIEPFERYPLGNAHEWLRATLDLLTVPHLDLLDALRELDATSLQVSPTDHHPNAKAIAVAAAATADFLVHEELVTAMR